MNETRRRGYRRPASFELARRRADRAVRQVFRDEQRRQATEPASAEQAFISA